MEIHPVCRASKPSWLAGISVRRGRLLSLLRCVGVSFTATGCDTAVDGDQWVGVTVTNTTAKAVTLDVHPARHLLPGRETVLITNSNSNPRAVRVLDAEGHTLGCLIFRTTSPVTRTVGMTAIAACDPAVPELPDWR